MICGMPATRENSLLSLNLRDDALLERLGLSRDWMTDSGANSGLPDGGEIGDVIKRGCEEAEAHKKRHPRPIPDDDPDGQLCILLNDIAPRLQLIWRTSGERRRYVEESVTRGSSRQTRRASSRWALGEIATAHPIREIPGDVRFKLCA